MRSLFILFLLLSYRAHGVEHIFMSGGLMASNGSTGVHPSQSVGLGGKATYDYRFFRFQTGGQYSYISPFVTVDGSRYSATAHHVEFLGGFSFVPIRTARLSPFFGVNVGLGGAVFQSSSPPTGYQSQVAGLVTGYEVIVGTESKLFNTEFLFEAAYSKKSAASVYGQTVPFESLMFRLGLQLKARGFGN